MSLIREIEPGDGRTILILAAHADDPTLFLGGTILRWADAGWRVVCVRATDDRTDSLGLTEPEAIAANAREFREAAALLGIAEVVDLGYPTDTLADVSEVSLREHFIRAIRRVRPYALVSFDPYAMYGEDNQDHLKVAAAADEAFWTSQFDLHHPEHFAQGLRPHGCYERWYFGRRVTEVTDAIDISKVLLRKIAAAQLHRTMMKNFFNQLRLQATTGGWSVPVLDEIAAGAAIAPLVELMLSAQSQSVGARHGVLAAEEFRVVRFGGMEALLETFGTRRPPSHHVQLLPSSSQSLRSRRG
jgi:LmbE family N-acetylglucosaminyl deacetylase